jgi:Tfp pilus assembly protein PilW
MRRTSGVSLIEVVIASAIMAGLVFMVYLILNSSTTQTANQSVLQNLDAKSQAFLKDFSDDFRRSGSTVTATTQLVSTDPFYDLANSQRYLSLRFSLPTSFTMGTPTSGSSSTYDWHVTYFWDSDPLEIAGNGKDDDLDGLTDEGVIRKIEITDKPDPADATKKLTFNNIVLHNVTKNGLAFQYETGSATNANDVTVFLELQAIDPTVKNKRVDDPDPTKRPIITRRSVTGVSRRAN